MFTLAGAHSFVLPQRTRVFWYKPSGPPEWCWRWQIFSEWCLWATQALGKDGNMARQPPSGWGGICGREKHLGWFLCLPQQIGKGSVVFSKYFFQERSPQMFGGFWDWYWHQGSERQTLFWEFFPISHKILRTEGLGLVQGLPRNPLVEWAEGVPKNHPGGVSRMLSLPSLH